MKKLALNFKIWVEATKAWLVKEKIDLKATIKFCIKKLIVIVIIALFLFISIILIGLKLNYLQSLGITTAFIIIKQLIKEDL